MYLDSVPQSKPKTHKQESLELVIDKKPGPDRHQYFRSTGTSSIESSRVGRDALLALTPSRELVTLRCSLLTTILHCFHGFRSGETRFGFIVWVKREQELNLSS